MTLDIKRTAGRPKKLPDIMPQLEEAIAEWEEEDQEIDVEVNVTHTLGYSDKMDEWLWFFGKAGLVLLIWALMLHTVMRI